MTWAKYTITNSHCPLPRNHNGDLTFYASTLTTAQAFTKYWGGTITPLHQS